LFKFQSSHTILIYASIRGILASGCKRPIENDILFVDDKINSDSIGQHIVPYGKADSASLSKQSFPKAIAKVWLNGLIPNLIYSFA
jgi:hypothetical protein